MSPHKPAEEAGLVGDGLSDEEVVRQAMSATNGEKLARLWMGDRSNYASGSEAGLAERSTEVTG